MVLVLHRPPPTPGTDYGISIFNPSVNMSAPEEIGYHTAAAIGQCMTATWVPVPQTVQNIAQKSTSGIQALTNIWNEIYTNES